MLKNYLTTIIRQIKKNKLFSFINILGLALGMAACLVIGQYVNFHRSFDQFHTHADRIFRIESKAFKNGDALGESITSPSLLTETLKAESSQVVDIARFFEFNYANSSIIYNDEGNQVNFEQPNIYITDEGVFNLFDFAFEAGSAVRFDEPQKAILTLDASRKYFDNPEKAIGNTFTLSGNTGAQEYELIGVLKELPKNSHLQFELLLSYPSAANYTQMQKSWGSSSVISYVLADDPSKKTEILSQVIDIHDANSKESYAQNGYVVDYYLQPLSDIHLKTGAGFGFSGAVTNQVIVILSIIAVVILIIAWINYMNLSLVRTMERLKEMGVRKCMGSSMKQITLLFILEALVMNMIALGCAVLITQVSEAYLIQVTELPVSALLDVTMLGLLTTLMLAGTIIIGIYPYALLKAVNIVHVLVGQRGKPGSIKMRKGMVLVQFMITFILIAGTLTVYNQINFMRDADLGIDIENVLVIKSPPGDINSEKREDVQRLNTLKTALLNYPSITEITNAGEMPGEPVGWGANLSLKNEDGINSVYTGLISMDLDFPQFFGIDIIAGRALQEGDSPWTRGETVVNQKMTEMLGFSTPEDALGAEMEGGFFGNVPLKIIGVVENHHHTSLHDDYRPLAYILSSWTEYYFVKIELNDDLSTPRGDQLQKAVANVKTEWNQIFTDYQMDYFFLDRAFDAQYKEDIRFGKIFSGFATIAILIACLGLFGLTSFTIQQRTKEIGIRKVLGATGRSLLMILSREYLILVATACLVSIPIAWWIMSEWLTSYTFRIDLGWWFFIVPVAFVLSMALFSIVFKILETMKTNPIESLRYE